MESMNKASSDHDHTEGGGVSEANLAHDRRARRDPTEAIIVTGFAFAEPVS